MALARLSFLPGTTKFPAREFTAGTGFQGYAVEADFRDLLGYAGSKPQNTIAADSRLAFLRIVLPPNTTNVPLGCDILLKGFTQLDAGGTVVGRTTRFLSLTNSTAINCRLPPAVRQQYIHNPETSTSTILVVHFRYYADKPSTAAVLPVVTAEMRFLQQPIETYIVR